MEKDYKTLAEQPNIAHTSKFFGLLDCWTYKPTGSRLHTYQRAYNINMRDELKNIFSLDEEMFIKHLRKLPAYQEVCNGNMLIEGMVSKDKQFITLHLHQFEQIGYEPVGKTYVLQGEAAQQAASVLAL